MLRGNDWFQSQGFTALADRQVGWMKAGLRAMYRPAAVIKDGKEAGSVMLVTNILTEHGPVVVEIKTTGDMDGRQAAIVRSAYTKESGLVADWVNGKDAARQVLYIDPLQIGEAVTGNLNPENQNATRKGWRVVPATGEINDFRPNAWGPTSPTSDKQSIAKWGTPANKTEATPGRHFQDRKQP